MKIGRFCKRNSVVAHGNMTALRAAKLMRDSGAKATVVVDADRKTAIGIVSLETLVSEVMAAEKSPATTRLKEVMSEDFASVKESESLFDTIRFMFDRGLQCVVITEEDGRLGGLVTLEELFAELTMELIEFSTVEEERTHGAAPERAGSPGRATAPVFEAIVAAGSAPVAGQESFDQVTSATRH